MEFLTKLKLVILFATFPLLLAVSVTISAGLFVANALGIQILIMLFLLSIVTWEIVSFALPRSVILRKVLGISSDNVEETAKVAGTGVLGLPATVISREPIEGKRLEGSLLESFVSNFLESEGFRTVRNLRLPSGAKVGFEFDMIAMKGNLALVIEVKSHSATFLDLSSLLGRVQIANLAPIVGNKRVVPVLVARNYSKSLGETASKRGVEVVTLDSLPSLALLNPDT
jgi:Holliday junction resolvase